MKIQFSAQIANQAWRYDDQTGFLRVTAVILSVGVLQYVQADLPAIQFPAGVTQMGLYVSPEALSDPRALVTLEGVPATAVDHLWQNVSTVSESVGNIAGKPCVSGSNLIADILVTDPETVRRIMLPEGNPDRLQEISSAFDSQVTLLPGVDITTGKAYQGQISEIIYNHVTILPLGVARGGSGTRIINRKEVNDMPDFTRVQLRNKSYIRVHNDDVSAFDKDKADTDTEVDSAPDMSKLQDLMDQLAKLNPQIDALTQERDNLVGQLQAMKEQLDAAVNPDNVEQAAQALNADREDATKVMNAHGLTLDEATRKLRGHPLRLAVVNSIRTKANLPLLDAAKTNEGIVEGMYSVYKDGAPLKAPVLPTGHQIVNSGPTAGARDLDSNQGRARAAYPHLFPKTDGAAK